MKLHGVTTHHGDVTTSVESEQQTEWRFQKSLVENCFVTKDGPWMSHDKVFYSISLPLVPAWWINDMKMRWCQNSTHHPWQDFAIEIRENKFTETLWQEAAKMGKKVTPLMMRILSPSCFPRKKEDEILVHCLLQSRDIEEEFSLNYIAANSGSILGCRWNCLRLFYRC